MTVQADKTIGFLYEEETFCGTGGGGYTIAYKNYSIEDLTGGLYTYDLEYDPSTTVLPLTAVKVAADAECMTVTFNKPVQLTEAEVVSIELTEGVMATFACNDKDLVFTYEEPLASGKYTLTVPAGFVYDADGQGNEEVTYSFRLLPTEVLPLGETVTKLSEVSEEKTYILYNPTYTAKAIYAPQYSDGILRAGEMTGDGADHALSNPTYAEEVNPADPYCSWMLVQVSGSYYLYNVGLEQCLVVGENSGTRWGTFSASSPVEVKELSNGFAFSTTGGTYDWLCAAPQLSYPISVWTSDDSGSCWQLIENPNVEADLAAGGIITGIGETVLGEGRAAQGIYTLDGRRLEALPSRRGIYVVNGKKVVKF